MPTLNYSKNVMTVRIDHKISAYAAVGWLLYESLLNTEYTQPEEVVRGLRREVNLRGTPDYHDMLTKQVWGELDLSRAVSVTWRDAIALGYSLESVEAALSYYTNDMTILTGDEEHG